MGLESQVCRSQNKTMSKDSSRMCQCGLSENGAPPNPARLISQ